MSGPKYSSAVTHLESQVEINPEVQMFMQEEFYQAEPYVVSSVMAELSLNSGLR